MIFIGLIFLEEMGSNLWIKDLDTLIVH